MSLVRDPTAGPPPVIELRDVHLLYGPVCALDIERMAIGASERVFVLGHSGSGKSTLARLIKGRLQPSTGQVRVFGGDPADVAAPAVDGAPQQPHGWLQQRSLARRIAMIDQEFFLVPRLTVIGNVLHGALGRVSPWKSLFGWYPTAIWQQAEEILAEVELAGLGNRRVETLSGGQRQRVAIARALMQEADLIVADEPISALDPELAEEALELLVECVARRGVTLIVNLHQPELARRFASRLIGLAHGRVVYDGPPQGFSAEDAELVYRGQLGPRGGQLDDRTSALLPASGVRPDLRLVRD